MAKQVSKDTSRIKFLKIIYEVIFCTVKSVKNPANLSHRTLLALKFFGQLVRLRLLSIQTVRPALPSDAVKR